MSASASTSLAPNPIRVSSLRSQHPASLLGLPGDTPLLSWKLVARQSGLTQQAAEIQVALSDSFETVLDSKQVKGADQIEVEAPGGKLESRQVRYYRVRVQSEAGWSEFSEPLRYEAGLLSASDFSGVAVGDDSNHSDPATLLRKDFTASSVPTSARLYISGHGVFEPSINGAPVAEEFLNPGWTVYRHRLNVATFDVTGLIRSGANSLGVTLGDGWYRGKLGFVSQYNFYGDKTSVILQLELSFADGSKTVIASDESFKTSTGEVRFGDIYDGSNIDYNHAQPGWDKPGFDDSKWAKAIVREFDKNRLSPRIAEPIAKVGEFPMKLTKQADRVLLDAGQNISGWVRLVVNGKKGQSVTVRHAEVLEPGAKLHTKALRSAKATDNFTLAQDGVHVLEPRFTFHGFQFADVVTDAEVLSGVGVAISSNTAKRSSFSSSDARLNRLHQNVVWSQRDNFVGLPTDCPQRDERLGWTGDAQAFANAANTLVDAEGFWRSWLLDLELDQDEAGNVAAVVPNILIDSPDKSWEVMGRAGWADAATIVPFSIYESFGSKQILVQQLNSMRRWTDALHNRRKGEMFLPTEFQFGDWCDPDAPDDQPWLSKVSADFVANCFFAHTASLTARAEKLVGTPEGVKKYTDLANELKTNIWSKMGEEALSTTAGCSIALEFEICPPSERAKVAKTLSDTVRKDNGRITTGFLGTPLILHALSKNGYSEEAYLMLMRREIRSWLYQVDMGATTIWERWDAIRADGSIHSGEMATDMEDQEGDGSMISFNHYAYGAVVDWVYRNVAGLAPTKLDPGYRTTVVAPKPAVGFSFASASIESPFGEISIDWQLTVSGDLVAELEVPFGVNAKLDLPVSSSSEVFVNGAKAENGSSLSYGSYLVSISNPALVKYN
jgi:alpha-L-rhamnosidase